MKTKTSFTLLFGTFVILVAIACSVLSPSSRSISTTETSVSVPTAIPSPTQDLRFSLDSGNTIPPDDVIQEIGYFGGAGGHPDCFLAQEEPYMYEDEYDPQNEFELMELVGVLLCNLPPNEGVNVTVSLPDGTTQNDIGSSDETGKFFYTYIPTLDAPVGTYTFSFDTSMPHFEKTVEIIKPKEARLYLVGEGMGQTGSERLIIFYNFKPNERIRLVAYKDAKLALWQEFIADSSGMVTVDNQLENWEYEYAAVGDSSGVVYYQYKGWGWSPASEWQLANIYCEGAPNPVPGIRPQAEVVVVSDDAFMTIYVNSEPQEIKIPRGTKLETQALGSPVCINEAYTWRVFCISAPDGGPCAFDGEGRIPEKVGDIQFIAPVSE